MNERPAESGRATSTGDEAGPSTPQQEPLLRDLLRFLRCNMLWWIAPIVIVLILMVVVALLAGPARIPFIYR